MGCLVLGVLHAFFLNYDIFNLWLVYSVITWSRSISWCFPQWSIEFGMDQILQKRNQSSSDSLNCIIGNSFIILKTFNQIKAVYQFMYEYWQSFGSHRSCYILKLTNAWKLKSQLHILLAILCSLQIDIMHISGNQRNPNLAAHFSFFHLP